MGMSKREEECDFSAKHGDPGVDVREVSGKLSFLSVVLQIPFEKMDLQAFYARLTVRRLWSPQSIRKSHRPEYCRGTHTCRDPCCVTSAHKKCPPGLCSDGNCRCALEMPPKREPADNSDLIAIHPPGLFTQLAEGKGMKLLLL
jgi:hypothetical protein